MDAQAGLGLCCSQPPKDRLSRDEAQLRAVYDNCSKILSAFLFLILNHSYKEVLAKAVHLTIKTTSTGHVRHG